MIVFAVFKLEMDQVTGGEVETHVKDYTQEEDAVRKKDYWNKREGNAYRIYTVKEMCK